MSAPSFLLALFALALTGCVSIGNPSKGPAVVHYVLADPGADAPARPAVASPAPDARSAAAVVESDAEPPQTEAGAEPAAPTLLVLDTTTSSFYDTDRLVFSRSAGTRGQYQFARWTERPGKRFADLMRARLDRDGTWDVSAGGGYVRGDLLLDTELVEFYHDAVRQPGHIRMTLRAEVVDLKSRTLLARRTFEQQVPVPTFDAAGAAQASSLAVGRMLDALSAWLATLQ